MEKQTLVDALEEWGYVRWPSGFDRHPKQSGSDPIASLYEVLRKHGLEIVDIIRQDAVPGTVMGLAAGDTKCPECNYITFTGKPECHADRCPRKKQLDPIFFPPLDADERRLWIDTYVAAVRSATNAPQVRYVADQAVRDYRSSVRARG